MNSRGNSEVSDRLPKIRSELAQRRLEAALISQTENRRYLSGFDGEGFLLISPDRAILVTDSRYTEQAREQAPSFEIVQIRGEVVGWFPQVVSGLRVKEIGFEAKDLSFATHHQLSEVTKGAALQLVPTEELVESLRAVKEEGERQLITKAAKLADAAFDHIASILHPGMTEREAAWRVERFLREGGSESMPFEIIVASGPNSALPHAKPTERTLAPGEPIVIDLGARVGGYSSDLSRTVCLGPKDETFTSIYALVLRAQLTAISNIEVGMSGDGADELARTVIDGRGYKDKFGHGLGHGVGLAIHEEPTLSPNSPAILREGMVFTIEPGIYIKGWGGVRIEDTVVLEGGKVKVLTRAKK